MVDGKSGKTVAARLQHRDQLVQTLKGQVVHAEHQGGDDPGLKIKVKDNIIRVKGNLKMS